MSKSESGSSLASFVGGMLLGGAIGAAFAYMLTPEDKKKIATKASKLLDKSLVTLDRFQENQLEPFLNKMGDNLSNKSNEPKTDAVVLKPKITTKVGK